jgi:hypothetical protein
MAMLGPSSGAECNEPPAQRQGGDAADPPGAQVFVDGAPVGTTPTWIPLTKQNRNIVMHANGYTDSGCVVTASVGAGWVVIDILTGFVPLIVDAITNDWQTVDQDTCAVRLSPSAR